MNISPDRTDLIAAAAAIVSRPRREKADSFQLHAPLELMARVSLVDRIGDDDEALVLIEDLGAAYGATNDGFPAPPGDQQAYDGVTPAAAALADAIATGDPDRADPPAHWLGGHATADELTAVLGPTVLPCVSAAGHGPIYFQLLADHPGQGGQGGFTPLIRPLARELARRPTARITTAAGAAPVSTLEIVHAVAELPNLGPPDPTLIWPLVDQAQSDTHIAGELARLATPDNLTNSSRALLRLSQWSMLGDTDAHVPYGWTHGLTLPAAALHLGRAIDQPLAGWRVALTHVVAHRAGLAEKPLVEPTLAANNPDPLDLARRAAHHHDAHVVKYVLICLKLADSDNGARSLHLQAADRLLHWWSA